MLDDLRFVVDNLPDAVIVQSEGKVVWANRPADRMFGHRDGELLGRPVVSLVAPAEPYGIVGPPRETHMCRRGGTHFLAEVRAVSVTFRGEPAIMTVCRDLTDVRAQRELALGAVILATMTEGVMMVRRSDDTAVYVNPFMARILGYEPEELIGRDPRMLRPTDLSPAEVARREAFVSRFRSGPGEGEVELSARRKDGTHILLRSRGSVYQHPEHGTVDVFVVEDVTALRAAERDRDQQERAVRRSLAEKDVLLREIHHRVKNNLQVISSLLALKARRTRDPVAHDALRESQARVRAIAILHERLFRTDDLARVDLGEYARSVAGEVLRSFGARERLDCRVSGPELELPLDIAVPCGLILNELVTNAVKHAFPDERSGHITVTLAAEGEAVALTVADDGVGDTGPLDKPGSLGITLVRTLASQLDGEATFTVGEGTTCRVRFPAKPKAA